MGILKKFINKRVYMVAVSNTNRFIFVRITLTEKAFRNTINTAKNVVQWKIPIGDWMEVADTLPEDVQEAVEVMGENDVDFDVFTGIVSFDADTRYYIMTK